MTYDDLKSERNACARLVADYVRDYLDEDDPEKKQEYWELVKKLAHKEKQYTDHMQKKDQSRYDREELGIEA